jgi:hypothetical protein
MAEMAERVATVLVALALVARDLQIWPVMEMQSFSTPALRASRQQAARVLEAQHQAAMVAPAALEGTAATPMVE